MTSTRSVVIVPSWALEPRGRPARWCANRRAVLARQPQDAAPAGADTGKAQPRPQLAVALAVEGAGSQELPDFPDQILVQHRAERPGSLVGGSVRSVPMAVDGRARHAPDPCHPLQAVDLVRRGRDPPAHRLDLLGTKGRLDPSCSILASSNSLAIVRSPTFSLRRPISASRALVGRVFNDASPAARKAPRQLLKSAAVTPSWRDSSSRSSPRNSLSTASCLRRADIRPRRSGVDPPPPAWWARPDGPTPASTSSSILHLLAVLYLQSGVSKNCRPGDRWVQLLPRRDNRLQLAKTRLWQMALVLFPRGRDFLRLGHPAG